MQYINRRWLENGVDWVGRANKRFGNEDGGGQRVAWGYVACWVDGDERVDFLVNFLDDVHGGSGGRFLS